MREKIIGSKHDGRNHLTLIFCLGVLFLQCHQTYAQIKSLINDGNKSYKKEKYEDAQKSYEDALNKDPDSYDSNFNLGDALYQQKKYKESESYFQRSTQLGKDKNEKEIGYYNLGNTYLKQNKIEESLDAYKQALKLNPNDLHAKANLSYAIEKKREMEKKQKQNPQMQNQGNHQSQKMPMKPQNGDKSEKLKGKNLPLKQKEDISDADAEQIMNALKNGEQKIRQRLYNHSRHLEKEKTDKPW